MSRNVFDRSISQISLEERLIEARCRSTATMQNLNLKFSGIDSVVYYRMLS
jgi:hypothetical protein